MRNNRRDNEIFIGNEFLSIEGRTAKHPSLIEYYANLNVNKTSEDLIDLIGVDIETNHLTGEMKLLGLYHGNDKDYLGKYAYYTENHLDNLISNIKYAISNNKNFAFWNSLDAFQIFRLFLLYDYTEEREARFMKRFGKISGEFNKGEWIVDPVIAIETPYFKIGIKQVIRTSIQFYIEYEGDTRIQTCWGYNVASLFTKGLEKEADINKGGRFTWYSKVDQSAHLVDWDRFETDTYYRNEIVLKSNELDARSAMALGFEIQKDFFEAFGSYPVSLISQGSHARSAVTAQVENDLIKEGYSGVELQNKKYEEISSIPLITHIDKWLGVYPEKMVKDLFLKAHEAYSGGYIEAIRYGYTKKGWYADIAAAYPANIKDLYDLRGSTLEEGTGEPPEIENAYIFIRGLVTIPDNVNFHPLTIKHPIHKDTNIRPVGTFYATYIKDERDFLKKVGATFKEESWTAIITKGEKSVLSKVTNRLIDLRKELIAKGSYAEGAVKRQVNSIYGIQYEAVEMFTEGTDGEPIRSGYRGGEFLNAVYATLITARTRLVISEACYQIEKAGGEVIIIMTDSLTWKGKKSDLPPILNLPFGESGVKEEKTLGYFETPELVEDIVCLGSGRYGFKQKKDTGDYELKLEQDIEEQYKFTNKRRGLNIISYENKDNIKLDKQFTWENVLRLMKHNKSSTLDVTVRALISVGVTLHRLKYNSYDLGKIIEETRNIDIIVGKTKRMYDPAIEDPELLSKQLVMTTPLFLDYNSHRRFDYVDGTFPTLRSKTVGLTLKTRKFKKKNNTRKRQKKFYDINKKKMLEERKQKYLKLLEAGFNRTEAKSISSKNLENVNKAIEKRLSECTKNLSTK